MDILLFFPQLRAAFPTSQGKYTMAFSDLQFSELLKVSSKPNWKSVDISAPRWPEPERAWRAANAPRLRPGSEDFEQRTAPHGLIGSSHRKFLLRVSRVRSWRRRAARRNRNVDPARSRPGLLRGRQNPNLLTLARSRILDVALATPAVRSVAMPSIFAP